MSHRITLFGRDKAVLPLPTSIQICMCKDTYTHLFVAWVCAVSFQVFISHSDIHVDRPYVMSGMLSISGF